MQAYILAREDAVAGWRELMGPTKVFRALYTSPTTIRAQFGLTDTRNTTHGSGKDMGFVESYNMYDIKHLNILLLQWQIIEKAAVQTVSL